MLRKKRYGLLLVQLHLLMGGLLLLGCSQMATPTLPEEGNPVEMTPTHSTPIADNLENLIERTKEDLANRLVITTAEISVVEATEVEWSDSSLDCPQPGMEYIQVITPGYRIVLQVDDQVYEYHSNRGTYFVYCENQSPPGVPRL